MFPCLISLRMEGSNDDEDVDCLEVGEIGSSSMVEELFGGVVVGVTIVVDFIFFLGWFVSSKWRDLAPKHFYRVLPWRQSFLAG